MILPNMSYSSGIRKVQWVKFRGLNRSAGAGDGELWDMKNMSGDHFPVLSTRPGRLLYRTLSKAGGLFSWEGLCWTQGTEFYFRGEKKGTVSEGEKVFAALGAYIVIFPDKAYYNTATGQFGSLESRWSGTGVNFTNGLIYEEQAEANTIQVSGVNWANYFRAGDAVTIEGCTKFPVNNKTPIIREISGDKLYFSEYAFTLDGEEGNVGYTEPGTITISRAVPDLDFLCANENRMWGCKGDTIYASKLGDVFNWNVFDGLDTDAYAVDTGTAGGFTACVSFKGYPVFFKEDRVFKVYGSRPSNFEVMGAATLGVRTGSARSLAVAGETLFYLSRAGIMAYNGGMPSAAGEAFGTQRFVQAVGGSDGLKYYVSLFDGEKWSLCVFDTTSGMWHVEDETQAVQFAVWDGNLYFLNDAGQVWITGNILAPPADVTEEGELDWYAEFADFTDQTMGKKGVAKLQVRLELDPGAEVKLFLQFDSDGQWLQVSRALGEGAKRSYYLPVIPRRCDHYRLRIKGRGGCRIYALGLERYAGSELRSTSGRN